MEELIKKFEKIGEEIHYREMAFEIKKDIKLSLEQYKTEKNKISAELTKVRGQIDDLHDKEVKLENDLIIFEKFEELEQAKKETEVFNKIGEPKKELRVDGELIEDEQPYNPDEE